MSISGQCILEISELSSKAQKLARGSAKDRQESAVLLQRIANLRTSGISSDEARVRYAKALGEEIAPSSSFSEKRYEEAFVNYLKGRGDSELRDLQAGTQSITYTQGASGGYLVPLEYEEDVFEAVAQTDPLLDENVCDFVVEKSPTLQPKIIDGYDLSTISAVQINEATQQTAGTFPTVKGGLLRGNIIYKLSLGVTWESDIDIPDVMGKISRALGVGFARKLGADAVNGNGGTTAPAGVLTGATSSGYSTSTGVISRADINAIYFSLNRVYRNQPKCAWLMNDVTYQRLRNASDTAGRPLISIENEWEKLMGKPIYVCPSIAGDLSATNSTIIFGDLGHFHIRCSRPTLQRVTQASITDITQGKSLMVGRIRMDSQVFDPSSGSSPPIITAVITK